MGAFASVLEDVPDTPMMPEWIGIQSRGMKQWITLKMAQHFGVCANMLFLFPRQIVDQILTNVKLPGDGHYSLERLNEDDLFWSVMKLIKENRSKKELSGIYGYIKDDETGKKLYQLSMKMAKVFDDYQVYRPYMLNDWQTQQKHDTLKDPVAQWQSWLWNQMILKDPENHLAFKAGFFLSRSCSTSFSLDHFPSRISLFGVSTLPPVFLQVFEKVSQTMDINLFLLVPSHQYFFDIKSEKQIKRLAVKETSESDPGLFLYEMTHPLLSSLGAAAKGFHSNLETFNYHEPFDDLFSDPLNESRRLRSSDQPETPDTQDTMLAMLQSDILNLVHRKNGLEDAPVNIDASDTSICVHACHSPMREAQVLKDLLLNEFEKNSELSPHDIIVMMPDIEAYAPFIESVFSRERPLPFSISDRRKKSESEPLDAFLKILMLGNTRLEQSRVLDLLLSESIAEKFNITFDEISMIEKMVEDANILWGKNADHRDRLGLPPFEENTWQFGLQRLFMGMAMPEQYEERVNDILPCHSFEGLDLEVLGKFAGFCHTLFSCLEMLDTHKTIETWCQVLKKVSISLMDRNVKNGEDLVFLTQTIDQIKENARNSEFTDTVSFDIIRSVMEHKLNQNISQGNFLAGNITFCNILPMRSIPFKIVVLMGMDEKSFPRQAFNPGFDLIKKYPEMGDKIEREEDRYLFLETLLSARSKFIVTYTGMSIQDNSMVPCAGVVSELLETMDQSFVFSEPPAYHLKHRLHPFDEAYFNPSGSLSSYSSDNCHIATAICKNRSEHVGPEKRLFVKNTPLITPIETPVFIPLDDVLRFFRNPVEGFMKQGLEINIPLVEEKALDREVFSLSGLDQFALGSYLIEKGFDKVVKTDPYPVLKAMGVLPFGEKGRLEVDKIKAAAEPVLDAAQGIVSKRQLPAIAAGVTMDGLTITSNFSDIREDGVYGVGFGKLNSSRLLSGWIRHLFINISAPEAYPKETILIGRDPKGKKPVITCSFPSLGTDAKPYFSELIRIYKKGQESPFYFFSETSWQFTRAIAKENFELTRKAIFKAMGKSKAAWYGGFYQTGEIENRYVSLCVENNDPFKNVDTLMSCGFAQNAVTVYKPLLENLIIL